MILRIAHREDGQTLVEFAIIGLILMVLTLGLVDVGRAFFQYNAVAAAGRYGARWGSVEGGTCGPRTLAHLTTQNGWCSQLGSGVSPDNPFWDATGNRPVWGDTTTQCPTSYSSANDTNSYLASNYTGNSSTTIVGAIVHRFDTSASSTNFIVGNLTPGLDLSKTRVCIQLSTRAWNTSRTPPDWTPFPGDVMTVYVYYPFYPVSALLSSAQINLVASSQYQIEGT